MDESVTEIVRELVELSKVQPLKGERLERAKSLMRKLRRHGYTSQEIEKLTKKRWSEATIKLYTRGEQKQSGDEKASAIDTMAEMISSGVSVEDVRAYLDLNTKLSTMGLSIEGLATLLREAQDANLALAEISTIFDSLKAGNLSISMLGQIHADMSELKAKGISADDLAHLAGIARRLGSLKAIDEALASYGSLQSLKKELENANEEIEKKRKEKLALESQMQALRDERSKIDPELKLHKEMQEMGFDRNILLRIKALGERFGGVDKTLKGLDRYSSIGELDSSIVEKKKQMMELDSGIKQLEANYAHIASAVEMCKKLLHDKGFGLNAIQEVYKLAEKYGEPINVLKAIEQFGDVKIIWERMEELQNVKMALERAIADLKHQKTSLELAIKTASESVSQVAKTTSSMVAKSADDEIKRIGNSCESLLLKLSEATQKYTDAVARAGAMEEELKFARVVNAIHKYPTEVSDLPASYGIMFLEAASKFLRAKGLDPAVKIPEEAMQRYGFIGSKVHAGALDLIDLCIAELKEKEQSRR